MLLSPREEKNTKAGQDPSHYMQNGGKESQRRGTPLFNGEEEHHENTDLERHVRGPTIILPPLPHLSSTHHLSPWAQPLAL